MAGPNLEVFKFGVYMFFPVWIMFKFGDPQWYQDYVLPYKHTLWPAYEKTNRPPRTLSDIDAELARYKAERAAKKVQQQFEGAAAASSSSSSSSSSADGPGGAGTGGQSAIATTTSAFYGRRAAGEGVAGTVLAGNDGERMV